MQKLTHAQLCSIASRWLRRPHSAGGHGCQVAFTECRGGTSGETPDAIGFRACGWLDGSIVVECKTSRPDFLADAKKPHRRDPPIGMGRWRYFLAPEGVIQPAELPAGWGLLALSARGAVRGLCGPAAVLKHHSGCYQAERTFAERCELWAQPRNTELEVAMLTRLLQRVANPEQVNLQLREANGRATRAWAEVERLRSRAPRMTRPTEHL